MEPGPGGADTQVRVGRKGGGGVELGNTVC